jgi:deoxycytidylate deaminase
MIWQTGFDAARAASQLANAPRRACRIGAALFSGPRLLSLGFNTYGQSHPQDARGYSMHAEHRALLRRRHYDRSAKLILYVYRETADGQPAHCRPCSNCLRLIRIARVAIVRFIGVDNKAQEIRF